MAMNDTFTIQEVELDTKDFLYYIKAKEIKAYRNKECEQHPCNNHCKVSFY